MTQQNFNDIYSDELAKGAIINNRHPGFREDYLAIHCLIRKYKPASLFEIGTNGGFGTKIIKNAIGGGVLFSLDLPEEEFHKYQKHPERIGMECDLPYVQLYGDSLAFDYSRYPAEAYFVDGAHDYEHVFHETMQIMDLEPQLIVFHDADIQEVMDGILQARNMSKNNNIYDFYRVPLTRIVYAIQHES